VGIDEMYHFYHQPNESVDKEDLKVLQLLSVEWKGKLIDEVPSSDNIPQDIIGKDVSCLENLFTANAYKQLLSLVQSNGEERRWDRNE